MQSTYHAINPKDVHITSDMADNFYDYMALYNRSIFYISEDDSDLIATYGLSRADITLLHEAHLTYHQSAGVNTSTIAKNRLPANELSVFVAEEFTERVKTLKERKRFRFEFAYKTSSGNTKLAVYTVTMPEGIGFHLYCHTQKPSSNFSIKQKNYIPIGLGHHLLTESKPTRLGGTEPLSRLDVYQLIMADTKKRKASLYFDEDTEDEAALQLPFNATRLQKRLICALDSLEFPQVGDKLADCLNTLPLPENEQTYQVIINKKIGGRYELIDRDDFDVIGYLDKASSRKQLPVASTITVVKSAKCYKLAG